jgi:hypothetical protein
MVVARRNATSGLFVFVTLAAFSDALATTKKTSYGFFSALTSLLVFLVAHTSVYDVSRNNPLASATQSNHETLA